MTHAPARAATEPSSRTGAQPSAAPASEPPVLAPRLRNLAFGVIAGGMFLASLDGTIVSTALPTIVGELNGATHITWVVTAYLLTSTIATALAGKFGDMFGRKRIYLMAIVLFVAASALCGAAQNMGWLIGARALQGIGGGALQVTAMAIIADIIPLADRGRYQGSLGAVFGLSTVLGPLLGGLFTDHLSWRWVFYVNLPVAAVLLPMAMRLLPSTKAATKPVIDYLGIAAVSLGSAGLILATSLGGTQYPWKSWQIISLFIGATVFMALFVLVESRAKAPLLPLRLFRRNTFTVSTILSFLVGFALMGCMTFMPTFLQYCLGISATLSGVRMLPMVIGLMGASIMSGSVVSKRGIYKPFPIVGAVIMALGMYLLSTMDQHSGFWHVSSAMFVIGVGIGLAMQVLTIIVQATSDYHDLGVATSGVTFFRSLGQSFGAAVFGTIYGNLLTPRLTDAVKRVVGITHNPAIAQAVRTPAGVHALPENLREIVVSAYANTLQHMFLFAVPVAVICFIAALFLKSVPLRGMASAGAADVGSGFGMPDQRSSAQQLESRISWSMHRISSQWYDEIARDASPEAVRAWVVRIVAIGQHRAQGFADASAVARNFRLPLGVLEPALANARIAGLVEQHPEGLVLTAQGFTAFRDVVSDTLRKLVAELQDDSAEPLSEDEIGEIRAVAQQLALVGPKEQAPRRAL